MATPAHLGEVSIFSSSPSRSAREQSDSDLAVGLAAGDHHALAELYDRYGGLALAVALRILGDPGRAEDVVQDIFVKVWSNAAQFDAARGSVRTWIITAVRNRSIDNLRGRGGRERQERDLKPDMPATGPASDPWRQVSLALERSAVREAMDHLPLDQRRTVELGYFGGYTHREIATLTGVPLSTVKGRMRISLEKLSAYLMGRGVFDDGDHKSPVDRVAPQVMAPRPPRRDIR